MIVLFAKKKHPGFEALNKHSTTLANLLEFPTQTERPSSEKKKANHTLANDATETCCIDADSLVQSF